MSFEQRNDSGVLFRNDKEGNEKRPDYTGDCMVNGKKMRIAAWLKKSKKGDTFMSLNFSEPREKANSFEQTASQVDLDEDVPF